MPTEKKSKKIVKTSNYMGLAYQLAIMLGLAILLGRYADNYLENETQYITAAAPLLVLIAYFYKLYKAVS